MKKRAFVLLSGGLDSTTCLFQAIKDFAPDGEDYEDSDNVYWVEAVSIDYGQRHKRELVQAAKICNMFGIKHTILDVGKLLSGKEILLSAESIGITEMVHTSYDDIKGVSPSYVPFRNGLMLSALTAFAQRYVNEQIAEFTDVIVAAGIPTDLQYARKNATEEARDLVTLYYGAHAEDAANWAYPDCTPEFNGSMANAIYTGSYNTIRLATPLQWMHKHEIVTRGSNLAAPLDMTWSCYDAGEIHCGECPTCIARKEAFKKANKQDFTEYAK